MIRKKENIKNILLRKHVIAAFIFLCVFFGYVFWVVTYRSEASQLQKESESLIRKIAAMNIQKDPDLFNEQDFLKVTRMIIGEYEGFSFPTDTEFTDINILEKFTNLEMLTLGKITYPRKGIPKWMIVLSKYGLYDIDKKFALDLSPLAKLNSLQTLEICNTHVKSIRPLSNLANLRMLNLAGTNIKSIEPLSKMVNLEWLDLNGTAINDLSPIRDFKKLEHLSIMQTNIANLKPVSELTNLQVFFVYGTQISDLEPLKGLTSLQNLYISGCKNITDKQVEDLQKTLPNLEIIR